MILIGIFCYGWEGNLFWRASCWDVFFWSSCLVIFLDKFGKWRKRTCFDYWIREYGFCKKNRCHSLEKDSIQLFSAKVTSRVLLKKKNDCIFTLLYTLRNFPFELLFRYVKNNGNSRYITFVHLNRENLNYSTVEFFASQSMLKIWPKKDGHYDANKRDIVFNLRLTV